MPVEKILVHTATGKVVRNVCRALRDAGFDVHGTTRSPTSPLAGQGVKPVVCNDTLRANRAQAA